MKKIKDFYAALIVSAWFCVAGFHAAFAGEFQTCVTSAITAAVEAPRGEDWWPQKASDLPKEATKQHGNVLIIGDSIAAKWPKSLPWPEAKTESVFRFAIGGDRTENILWRLSRLPIEQIAPTDVVVIAGTNNLSTATDACPVFSGIFKITSEIQRRVPQTHVTIIAILPRGPDFNYKPEIIDEINADLQAIQQKQGFELINAKDRLVTASGGHNPSPLYEDLVHLSPMGYDVLAEAIVEQSRAPKPR